MKWLSLYHLGTVVILCGVLGYLREVFLRRDYLLRRNLAIEKELSNSVLQTILPEAIIPRVLNKSFPIIDAFGEVTVIFADISGFSELTRKLPPKHMVETLDKIFSCFDYSVKSRGMERVKTIGDGYMAVAGTDGGSEHAALALDAAVEMVDAVQALGNTQGIDIKVRVGIATGQVIGAIVGESRYHYDYYGETVNLAKRLETAAPLNAILLSEETYWKLPERATFEERTETLKGAGETRCYLVSPKTNL